MRTPPGRFPDRRGFLRAGGVLGIGALLELAGARAVRAAQAPPEKRWSGYGPLRPARDETSGLKLLRLPPGFRYRSFDWRGDPVAGGGAVPNKHDGMGVVARDASGVLTLVRNHERYSVGTPIGPSAARYDPLARGGTMTLRFDASSGLWLSSAFSLGGTVGNCAGGTTPWGSWLSCEETLEGPEDGFEHTHGWVFEVPADGPGDPRPLHDMGRFEHEAAAVDPVTGFVYLTEDDTYTSGFYRFRPYHLRPHPPGAAWPSPLRAGGRLEMLAIAGSPQIYLEQVQRGQRFPVDWVPIPDPTLPKQFGVGPFGSFDGETTRCSGPFLQGFEGGGARFRRLEGASYDAREDKLYFVDTEGGLQARDTHFPEGALWRYDPRVEELELSFTSPAQGVLDTPDNVCVSPRGGLILCEDGDVSGTRLMGIGRDGRLLALAQNDVQLAGEVNGLSGDYRTSEWAGVCFDPTGQWLFANVQDPGITVAITGPWEDGLL